MDLLKRIAGYIRTMLANMTAVQKVAVVTLFVLIGALIVWGASAATANGWTKIVGTESSREERSLVIKKLAEKNYKYELRHEEIYVPKEIADQVVIELHGEDVLSDVQLWKFLDEANITASKWQQERRYQVAIQRKLERMISSVKSVERASVQLTPGDQAQALGFRGNEPTASVTVELKPGQELSSSNVKAIARLVANGMTGLKPHNVLIMDTAGRPYRLPQANTAVDLAESKLEMERLTAEWLRSEILRVHPNAMVGLRPLLSSDTISRFEEKAEKPVTVKKEAIKEKEKSENRTGSPSIKGGEGQLTPGDGAGTKTDRTASEDRTENLVPRSTVRIETPWGELKDLTVSVVLPVPLAEGENPDAAIQKEKARLDELKASIMTAVGLKEPNALSVTFMPTRRPSAAPPAAFKDRLGEFLERWGGSLILFLLVLVALIIVYKLLKAALPKRMVEDLEALRKKLGEEAVVGAPPELALAEEEIGRMKMTIREMVSKNPRNVASILKRWMTGK